MTSREASSAFAQGETPATASALSFRGRAVYSYEEPIAIRSEDGSTLYVTTARFSVTTSKHRTIVAGAFAVARGADRVVDVEHAAIRAQARSMGLSMGTRGAHK